MREAQKDCAASREAGEEPEGSQLFERYDSFYTAFQRPPGQSKMGAVSCPESSRGGFRCAETRLRSRA
jgi:hypothetical protein